MAITNPLITNSENKGLEAETRVVDYFNGLALERVQPIEPASHE